jgi:FPC/CPF motif-containing protein YcgG
VTTFELRCSCPQSAGLRFLVPAEGLFALCAHPFGVALKGDRRRCGVVEPFLFYVGGSTNLLLGAKLPSNNFSKMMPAEGLFALRAHPFGVALKGDRRRCGVVEPFLFYVGGSTTMRIRYQFALKHFL